MNEPMQNSAMKSFSQLNDFIKKNGKILSMVVVTAAVPLTIFIAQQQLDLRQRAALNDLSSPLSNPISEPISTPISNPLSLPIITQAPFATIISDPSTCSITDSQVPYCGVKMLYQFTGVTSAEVCYSVDASTSYQLLETSTRPNVLNSSLFYLSLGHQYIFKVLLPHQPGQPNCSGAQISAALFLGSRNLIPTPTNTPTPTPKPTATPTAVPTPTFTPTPTPDLVAPVISITSPTTTKISGQQVVLSAVAADPSGIAKIVLQTRKASAPITNFATVQTCTNTANCSYTWKITSLPAGYYEIRAIVTDRFGNASNAVKRVQR